MAWRGWDGRLVTIEQFKAIVATLPPPVWSKQVTLHNTDAPDIRQALSTPPATRMVNFENNYKNLLGWDGAPSLFIFPQGLIGIGTPLTQKSTHSAGFNGKSHSIEMCADFASGSDDDDSGVGLEVKKLACQAMAVLLEWLGLEPDYRKTWYLHKDDTRTTHDCPGSDIEAPDIQSRVSAYYDDLNEAGDHGDPVMISPIAPVPVQPILQPPARIVVVNVAPDDTLNFRDGSGMLARVTGKLPRGVKLTVLGEAKNASTTWLRVKTPLGYVGWVSAKYVAAPAASQPTAPIPLPTPAPSPDSAVPVFSPAPQDLAEPGLAIVKDHNDIAMAVFTGLPFEWKGKSYPASLARDHGLRNIDVTDAAGVTGNLMRESYARLDTGANGDKGTAFGIMQARNERQAALRAYAKQLDMPVDDIVLQLLYVLHELQIDDDTDEVYAGKLLELASTIEESTAAGVAYERPRGWARPTDDGKTTYDLVKILAAAKKSDGWSVRLESAEQMVREYPALLAA